MANNPYVNKVQKADGTVIMDITDTTAEAGDVLAGKTFYAKSGQRSTGTLGDMTGATSSTAGAHGLVPAPAAGDHLAYLRGDGTWDNPPGTKPITIALDTVTNTSGSYTHTTTNEYAVASMKPIQIECSNPDAFNDSITITVSDGSITLSCDDVAGTSDVSVVVMKQLDTSQGDPPAVTSTEFDILANRIGTLGNLTTTEKSNVVGAINEVKSQIADLPAIFIDPTNALLSITSYVSTQGTYTATENGFLFATQSAKPTTAAMVIKINDTNIAISDSDADYGKGSIACGFIKTGDVVTYKNCVIKIYGLRS